MRVGNVEISWLGHDSFKIVDVLEHRVIYIDPFKLGKAETADIILITHSHYDHCSIEDLQKISTPKTVILATVDCQSSLQGKVDSRDTVLMTPGKMITMGNIDVEAVPAYNTNKKFHPKENEWVGYVVDINSKRIYHAGDTDVIKEMSKLNKIDVALMPVSGTYVMTAQEAAKAVESFKPKLAVPMHYGTIIGDHSNAEEFKKLSKVPVEILKKE
jgi:L-ascorbate metabolism protein UlaG (beta-lactamase superfamily)